ncbi:hypothetical protein G7007_20860 [Pseudomonas entomophila]|jgi:hypothetical protein|uniref:hypothetical protein n=1 Tax=Pseudomonas entomophila TaxID=312306 RepID=UPI0015E2B15B|nr:hypothetical protein [Pseudomonas entomophila]MBA1195278.1 hypothetical protein [Pseudomonas entomophila]
MKPRVIIDTNLLVLLVVGFYSPDYISQHRNLQDYTAEDFEDLMVLINGAELVVSTAILTEASNLLWQTKEPHRTRIRECLRRFIELATERALISLEVISSPYFLKLGLTDAGILSMSPDSGLVLTVDLDLHLASLELGFKSDNFNNFRDFS